MADQGRAVAEQDQTEAGGDIQAANERAERAEAEVAKLRAEMNAEQPAPAKVAPGVTGQEQHPERHTEYDTKQPPSPSSAGDEAKVGGGEVELRKDSMMAHLLDSLDAGKDIGHYGRLVFAMVTRHFLPHTEVISWLTRDPDFKEEDAELMLRQTEGRDYSPPRRERLLEWQSKQEFPILPNADDPDCGNLYRNLTFPEQVYSHIGHYQEQKRESEA